MNDFEIWSRNRCPRGTLEGKELHDEQKLLTECDCCLIGYMQIDLRNSSRQGFMITTGSLGSQFHQFHQDPMNCLDLRNNPRQGFIRTGFSIREVSSNQMAAAGLDMHGLACKNNVSRDFMITSLGFLISWRASEHKLMSRNHHPIRWLLPD